MSNVRFVVNFHWNDTEEELDKTRNVARNLTIRKRYGLHQYNALVDLFVWLTTCNRASWHLNNCSPIAAWVIRWYFVNNLQNVQTVSRLSLNRVTRTILYPEPSPSFRKRVFKKTTWTYRVNGQTKSLCGLYIFIKESPAPQHRPGLACISRCRRRQFRYKINGKLTVAGTEGVPSSDGWYSRVIGEIPERTRAKVGKTRATRARHNVLHRNLRTSKQRKQMMPGR